MQPGYWRLKGDSHLKGKDDFPQEAQRFLSVAVNNISGVDDGA